MIVRGLSATGYDWPLCIVLPLFSFISATEKSVGGVGVAVGDAIVAGLLIVGVGVGLGGYVREEKVATIPLKTIKMTPTAAIEKRCTFLVR